MLKFINNKKIEMIIYIMLKFLNNKKIEITDWSFRPNGMKIKFQDNAVTIYNKSESLGIFVITNLILVGSWQLYIAVFFIVNKYLNRIVT
jgi:hypothetical protein